MQGESTLWWPKNVVTSLVDILSFVTKEIMTSCSEWLY
jgi:hypothetical protein